MNDRRLTTLEQDHDIKTVDERYKEWKERPSTFTMPKDVFIALQKQHGE